MKQIVIAGLGAAIGGSVGGTAVAVTGVNATVNNYLSQTEQVTRDKAKSDCFNKGDAAACTTLTTLNNLDAARDKLDCFVRR